jgi:hypothetical protein
MKRMILASALVGLAVGCSNQPATPPPAPGGVKITAPGVNVTVDPKGGANVTAPGVNVTADPKGGAKVDVNGK